MTDNTTTQVTDADRELFAALWEMRQFKDEAEAIRKGDWDADMGLRMIAGERAKLQQQVKTLTQERDAARRAMATLTESDKLHASERSLILQDKEINNIVQCRIETGAWVMGTQGYLAAPWEASCDANGNPLTTRSQGEG